MTCSYYDHTFPPTMNLMNPHNNRKKHWTMKIKQLRSALFLIHFQNCPFCLAVSRQISGLLTSGLAGVWMSVGKTKDRLQNAPLMTVNILLSLPLLRSIRDCHAESVDHPRTGFAAPPHKRLKTSDTRCTSCFFYPTEHQASGLSKSFAFIWVTFLFQLRAALTGGGRDLLEWWLCTLDYLPWINKIKIISNLRWISISYETYLAVLFHTVILFFFYCYIQPVLSAIPKRHTLDVLQ